MPLKCENLRKNRKYLGIESGRSLHDQPVLGWVSGDTFYFAIDYTKDDDGNSIYYELSTTIGPISTLKGSMYRTVDGKSVDRSIGPVAVTLVVGSPSPQPPSTIIPKPSRKNHP